MAHINSIEIKSYRGIKALSVSDFSNINIVVGDNNSGKTSFLEAIQLLFAGTQLGTLKNIINQRTVLNPDKSSFYVSLTKMFNKEQRPDSMDFEISAESNSGILQFRFMGREGSVSGEEALQMSALSQREKMQYKRNSIILPEKAKVFIGNVVAQTGEEISQQEVRSTSLDSGLPGASLKKEILYISAFGHLRYDLLQNIVGNPEYKKLAVDILGQFETEIEDICYTKADDGSYLETIVATSGINMPLSVYGDGIKKILYILNKLFDSADSILLIDEIETGLHKKYYDMLFPVIFALASKLNVQLFIATHSIEAIDAILKYGDYDNKKEEKDPIKVITLKKIESKTGKGSNIVARNVTGNYVYENRKVFEYEVRL
ncbi:MAG: AAA family ATPase [Lachnospiraceae bacterium]|nr:AAA family ATPase [Lachnospiraceae bacterium]